VTITKTCSGPECGRAVRRNGLCDTHDKQAKRGAKLIPIVPKGRKGYWKRDENGLLRCMDCLKRKPDSEFYRNARSKTGLNYYCRDCEKDRKIERTYGIDADQYRALLELQDGKCAICFDCPENRALSVDHNHDCCPGSTSCGKCVRRLLCSRCNSMLGMAQDNASLLLLASQYLDDFATGGVLPHRELPNGE
jgi:hypothetical protein